MPAVSQQQQKIMGLALSVKRGETPRSKASAEVLKIVDSMSEKELEKYAGTAHKGLPKKVESKIREIVREVLREQDSTFVGYMELKNGTWKKIKDLKTLRDAKSWLARNGDNLLDKYPNAENVGYIIKNQWDSSSAVKESVNEGKKAFKVNPPIGKAKYSISSHDGHKKHNDGSDFWDIKIYKNKIDLEKGIKDYKSKGFIEESVNEEKVVTKKEWDRTHSDFKGMVDGKPYMMYLDPETGATVYGPVIIK